MSPTMVIPGDHCDIPPKSGWLNWAMLPPRSAYRIVRTASGATECRLERREIRTSSLACDDMAFPGEDVGLSSKY